MMRYFNKICMNLGIKCEKVFYIKRRKISYPIYRLLNFFCKCLFPPLLDSSTLTEENLGLNNLRVSSLIE